MTDAKHHWIIVESSIYHNRSRLDGPGELQRLIDQRISEGFVLMHMGQRSGGAVLQAVLRRPEADEAPHDVHEAFSTDLLQATG